MFPSNIWFCLIVFCIAWIFSKWYWSIHSRLNICAQFIACKISDRKPLIIKRYSYLRALIHVTWVTWVTQPKYTKFGLKLGNRELCCQWFEACGVSHDFLVFVRAKMTRWKIWQNLQFFVCENPYTRHCYYSETYSTKLCPCKLAGLTKNGLTA